MSGRPTRSDPVAEAARLIVRLVAAISANEDAQIKARAEGTASEKTRLTREYDEMWDALCAAEEFLTTGKAVTLPGAMAQVMIAMANADAIASHSSEEHHELARKCLRRVDRALYSALAVMSEVCGVDPAEVGGEYYASAEFNPHLAIDKARAA